MTKGTSKEPTSEEAYQELLKEYEEFSYIVSHDLQAPIRQLHGFSQILLNDLGDDLTPVQQSYKETIEHVAENANKTLEALLTFSRFSTNKKNFKNVDLNAIVKNALRQAKDGHSGVEFDFKAQELPSVCGDYDLLVQAFHHIIDNAITFRKEDTPLTIQVSFNTQKGKNTFCIEDNGIGIKDTYKNDVFTILRKFGPKDKIGLGTGLAFAKKIVQIHNGKIWIESKEGKGTKVLFTLPGNH